MSIARDALRGAVAGAAATWLMDRLTTGMLQLQAPAVTAREEAAQRNGKSSVANLVDRFEAKTGLAVPAKRRPMVESGVHYLLGMMPGAIYGVMRRRVPFARIANGLGYGTAIFAINDEYANAALRLSGPPGAYPLQTHFRGLAGHALLGTATETGIVLLGG
jgi:hypothetical protein